MDTLIGISETSGDEETNQEILGLQCRCEVLQQQLDSEREQFHSLIHSLSHDVRSCLNGVLGFAQLLQDDYKPEHAEVVIEGLYRIVRLVSRTVSTFDSGYKLGPLGKVDLNLLVPSVASTIIPPSTTLSCRLLPIVIADPVSLEQAVQNIIVNAIEHGNAEQIDVRVESSDEEVCILFRNNGKPIPELIRHALFRKRISSKEDGGLGLEIVKRIVKAHGWEISLDEGSPTTFRICIPHKSIISKNNAD